MFGRLCATPKRRAGLVLLIAGTLFQLGWVGTCNDRMLGLTDYVEPCGTIFGNCEPGDFQVYNSDIGDYCVDPACTVPGACENDPPPLGTVFDLCP